MTLSAISIPIRRSRFNRNLARPFFPDLLFIKPARTRDYSLTDCISMEAMRQEGISEILTHDSHFTQEGFTIVL